MQTASALRPIRILALTLALLAVPALLLAQSAGTGTQPLQADPDVRLEPLQPDFNLVALPTTLRVPRQKWGFRVTHRFTRPLGEGNFGDLAADAFGFDGGAQIGLEIRYGLARGLQVGVHRTSDRTIQFFGQHNVVNERDGGPLGLDVLVTLEGGDNLQEHRRSAIGFVLSRTAGGRAALYAEPMVVLNASPFDTGDRHTMLMGLGARARIRPATYLVAEITPRVAGYDPGVNQISFGIEGRSGGHLFQINFSNGFGTTLGQLAQGGLSNDDWYIGFNISRKFF